MLSVMGLSRSLIWPSKAKSCRSFPNMTPGRVVPLICILCLFCARISIAGKRTKRELRFPKGSSLVLGVAAVTFLPKGPTDGFAHFVEFDLGFPLPDEGVIENKKAQSRVSKRPSYKKVMQKSEWKNRKTGKRRGSRNGKEQERKKLMWKLEDAITRLGFNGSSCMSRFRCELRYVSPKNSLLEKLLIALFKTSDQAEGDCKEYVKTCPISLLHVVMHSQHISDDSL